MCDNPSLNGFGEDVPIPEPTGKLSMLFTEDPRCNYMCGSKGEKDIGATELIDVSKYDYQLGQPKSEDDSDDTEEDKQKSISYLSVNSIEEGIDWYKTHFPKIPDELYPIMSRWNWGDLSTLTKKDIKNDVKRLKKGKKPKQMCLEIKTGKFKVDFD